MATKYVYFFGNGKAEGRGAQRQLLGGKGAGLAEMTRIGLPVPAGFTITTDACDRFYRAGRRWPAGLEKQVREGLKRLERVSGKRFGISQDPLLVSVRSGAARSMPGMMETVLNLGLNDENVRGLAVLTANSRFAWDSYRRFIQMYSTVVVGLSKDVLESKLHAVKERTGASSDADIPAERLEELCAEFKKFFREQTGGDFPQDPWTQLVGAINAVFGSWMADKALTYRRVEHITGLAGTAVNVCRMVFGNLGPDSATGVCFTRDPSTGENVYFGDYLTNAQGEDVVAGIRTPKHLSALKEEMPATYDQLCGIRAILEAHYRDMQDIEFTVERGTLYMLQCRTGKRSPAATFKIAVDQATRPLLTRRDATALVRKRCLSARFAQAASRPLISRDQAIARITAVDIERLFYPVIDPQIERPELDRRRLAAGVNAVPGAANGEIVFSAEQAERRAQAGARVILVRKETSPEDVGGMHAAAGILTATGGKASHAAVVARGWGKCCIVGCSGLDIDYNRRTLAVNGRVLSEGDRITLDGSEGVVYDGELPLVKPDAPREYDVLMSWCDHRRRLRVRANADTPYDAANAIRLGAEGIGLCRTEHMFFDTPERRFAIQEMIMAGDEADRRRALDRLLPFQRQDFIGIFEAMAGRPVTIRLIDPPLHEFVPRDPAGQAELAQRLHLSIEAVTARVEQLHETNPMLGHRGCRLCITYPEILETQVRAILEAAVQCALRGVKVRPEIMIPLAMDRRELSLLTDRARAAADDALRRANLRIDYLIGTMIETPRAALLAAGIAEVAEFFSFGTNDLTQLIMGLSRDDAGRFLPEYVDPERAAILPHDPFQSLDREGVGEVVLQAVRAGRTTRPKLKIGVCGEHGGDAESVRFFHRAGLDYVSCSPFRLPIARLAAAQAVIEEGRAR